MRLAGGARAKLVLLVWATMLLLGSARVLAATVAFDSAAERFDLSDSMELLRDRHGQLHFTEVVAMTEDFRPARREDLAHSFNAGVFWLRFSLLHTGPEKELRWLTVGTPRLQAVTLYLRDGEQWMAMNSGTRVSMTQRPVVAAHATFPVSLVPGENLELLLRVESSSAIDMATTLWQPHAYRQQAGERNLLLALIVGGLLLGCLLSALVYQRLRDTSYAWLSLLLLMLSGIEVVRENLMALYLWPATRGFPPQVLSILAGTAVFSLAKLVSEALALGRHAPFGHRVLFVLRWIAVGAVLLAFFDYGNGMRAMALLAVTLLPASLVLSWLVWRRGVATGKTFALAFAFALLTETARQLANLGILPWLGAMNLSLAGFLVATPFILLSMVDQTRRLSQQLAVARQLQQAKTEFLARVSHELRSPLNTILGYARMLKRGSTRLSMQEGSRGIEKGALRLLGLIDELLDESRAAAGKLTTSPLPTLFLPWLDELCESALTFCEAQGNRFSCRHTGTLPAAVVIDGQRLRQVLENLLSNANRHTHQGDIVLECGAHTERDTATLTFAVRDSGEGIAPERLETIFEPFVRGQEAQTEDRRRRSGFGLGLSISRELVRQMGSDIAVTSRLHQGSCFSFTLQCPLATPDEAARADDRPEFRPEPLPAEAVRAEAQTEPCVLLVEDDAAQCAMLDSLLAESGYRVRTASCGSAADRVLHELRPDAVVTDQMMDDGDGWHVLQRVRATYPRVPVILLSAVPPRRPAGFPPEMDFDAVLRKPPATEDLLATLGWQIVKVDAGTTPVAANFWHELMDLAREGEVSRMEESIAALAAAHPEQARLAAWLRHALHRLDIGLIEAFVRQGLGQAASANERQD